MSVDRTEDEHSHPSPAHKAACPVCNPDKTVPQLNAAYAQVSSNEITQRYSGAEIHRGLSIDNHKHLRELQYVLASEYDARVEELQRVYKLVNHWAGEARRLESAHETRGQRIQDERTLRRLLAFAYSGSALYGDDGELQDGRHPMIDYVRDSVADIERKIHERGMATLAAAACPECRYVIGHKAGCSAQKANSCAYCEAGMQKVKEDLHYDVTNNSSHRCTSVSEGEQHGEG